MPRLAFRAVAARIFRCPWWWLNVLSKCSAWVARRHMGACDGGGSRTGNQTSRWAMPDIAAGMRGIVLGLCLYVRCVYCAFWCVLCIL